MARDNKRSPAEVTPKASFERRGIVTVEAGKQRVITRLPEVEHRAEATLGDILGTALKRKPGNGNGESEGEAVEYKWKRIEPLSDRDRDMCKGSGPGSACRRRLDPAG
jgi:hypothetical protein